MKQSMMGIVSVEDGF